MLIPIRHENMSARRWPVITLGLIAINIIVFLATFFTAPDDQQQQANRQVRAHLLMLAAMHTELTLSPQTQELVKSFQEQNPKMWAYLQDANRPVADGWDAKVRLMSDEDALQAEMDTLEKQYAEIVANPSVVDEYAFVPAHPRPITYLTANFLHGGWLHLIGNLWFLWLAGFVLEDLWGRPLYSIFYLVAGAAALQVHALTNAGSTVPASRRNLTSTSSRVPGLSGVPRAAVIRSSITRPSASRTVMCAAAIGSDSSPSGVTRAITVVISPSARLASLNSASAASPRRSAIAAQKRTLNFASSGVLGSRWSAAWSASGVSRQRTLSIASGARGIRSRIARPASIVACVR